MNKNVKIAKQLVKIAKELVDDKKAGMFDKKAGMFDRTASLDELTKEQFNEVWKVGKLFPDLSKMNDPEDLYNWEEDSTVGDFKFYVGFDGEDNGKLPIRIKIYQNNDEVFNDKSSLEMSESLLKMLHDFDSLRDEEERKNKMKEIWGEYKPAVAKWINEIVSKADQVWTAIQKSLQK